MCVLLGGVGTHIIRFLSIGVAILWLHVVLSGMAFGLLRAYVLLFLQKGLLWYDLYTLSKI